MTHEKWSKNHNLESYQRKQEIVIFEWRAENKIKRDQKGNSEILRETTGHNNKTLWGKRELKMLHL